MHAMNRRVQPLARRMAQVAVAAVAAVGVFGPVSVLAAEYNWRVSVVTPEGHPYNDGLAHFKERVESGSDGAISVKIFPSSQLGGEVESVKNVQLGTLDMTIVSTSNTSPFYQDLEVLGVPYSFKSLECAYKVLDGEIGQNMAKGLVEQSGLRVLGWYTFGMRQLVNTKRPILEPKDLNGLVFRVPADKMAEAAYKALGANPVPMAFPEMFNGFQQGVIDGADNPLITLQAFKWYEVVKYASITNTAAGLSPFLVSERAFQKLPDPLKELVLEAGAESAVVNRESEARLTADATGKLKENGVQIDEPDLAPFREAVQPVFDLARKNFGDELVESVLNAQTGC